MDISKEHPDLFRLTPLYKMIDDVLRGEEYIKGLKQAYLPYTSGMLSIKQLIASHKTEVTPDELSSLYQDYLERAQFPSWTEEAVLIMAGLITQIVPTPKLPKEIEYLIENATSDGFSLTELFQRLCYLSLRYGKCTLVADIDATGKAYFSVYDAHSEYNWNYGLVNGRKDLNMCAFKEKILEDPSDLFSHQTIIQRRAYIIQNGQAVVRESTDSADSTEVAPYLGQATRPLTYLPIVRISAIDGIVESSAPPLLPICRSSLKAYVLSADLNSGLHRSCHPQLYVTGVSSSPVRDNIQNSARGDKAPQKSNQLGYTGAGTVWTLPQGSTAGYVEPRGTGLQRVSEEITKQRTTALEAGAKVMNIGVESGDARKARQNDQYASLFSIVKGVAKAIEQCCRYAYDMVSVTENKEVETSIQFEIPSDFGVTAIDATMAAHLMSAAERGAISFETYWRYVATGKLPERTYDQEREVASKEDIELKPIAGMVQVATGKDQTPKASKAPENPS